MEVKVLFSEQDLNRLSTGGSQFGFQSTKVRKFLQKLGGKKKSHNVSVKVSNTGVCLRPKIEGCCLPTKRFAGLSESWSC